jgi:uncharacterized secreted protein with C-terminal beta-propeller domain
MQRWIALFICAVFILAAGITLCGSTLSPLPARAAEIKSFASYGELVNYIHQNTNLAREIDRLLTGGERAVPALTYGVPRDMMRAMIEQESVKESGKEPSAADFSRTNVQVTGVDEADAVKSDGRYLYLLSGSKVVIVRAYPAGEAKIISTISCEGQPLEILINNSRVVVFGYQAGQPGIFIRVYNVKNKNKPVLESNITCRADYVTSRMIGDYVYAILNMPVYSGADPAGGVELPAININGRAEVIPPSKIYYFPHPDYAYCYTTILTINLQDNKTTSKTFLTGISQNIYASSENIYLTGFKTPDYITFTNRLLDDVTRLVPPGVGKKLADLKKVEDPARQLQQLDVLLDNYLQTLDEQRANALRTKLFALHQKWEEDLARERDKTVIHKLAVNQDRVDYLCRGEVPGHVLNQFSMDEHRGMFRIATTSTGTSIFSGQVIPRNNIYVLDKNLRPVGKLEGLAPTERIYAARFMGDRAYLVTFRNIDPLFVVDLKNPRQPVLAGELKIPGYSTYLHPYDENYLIGIGREVKAGDGTVEQPRPLIFSPPTPREEGLKISLFDVSNPASPREKASYVISGQDADSPALYDHRAVLFDRSRNLLVIPVSFSPPVRILTSAGEQAPPARFWYGAYVFNISPEGGTKLKGKVAHGSGSYREGEEATPVKRALYIEDVLYTISDHLVKMNDLSSLKELKQLRLK